MAQKAIVACNSQNVLYIGIENSLDVAVGGYDCDSISLQIDHGILKKSGPCTYAAIVMKEGDINISVSAIKNGETSVIEKILFSVSTLPDPVVKICGLDGNDVKPAIFRVQKGLCAELEDFEIDARYEITSYKMLIIRSGGKVKELKGQGPYFTPAMLEETQVVFSDDIIVIDDVNCKLPDGRTVQLKPVVYNIKSGF